MASEILPSSQGIGKCGWGCSLELAQMVKNLPARQETQVRSLSGEDPLEKGMATHSSILAWRIPWMEETGGLHSTGSPRVRHSWATNVSLSLHCLFHQWHLKNFTVLGGGLESVGEVGVWSFLISGAPVPSVADQLMPEWSPDGIGTGLNVKYRS